MKAINLYPAFELEFDDLEIEYEMDDATEL
jgi:hypothetical protein